jgi:hypothetical protein
MEEQVEVLLYKFGPLYDNRKSILNYLKSIPLQTGDILYRFSDAKGPFNLPFGTLVARFTKSVYSHAAIVLMEKNEIYVLEVNDQGTLKYRMLDWLDACATKEFSIYRLKDIDEVSIYKLEVEIRNILETDPSYDFSFSDPDKLYCTESVALIYERAGVKLVEPQYIKEVVNSFQYLVLAIGNWIISTFSDCKLPLDQKCYFVGNEKQGLMSSKKTKLVYHFKDKLV